MTKARENSDYTGLQGDLALKSPVASPVFTGNVGVTGTNAAVNVICGGVTEDSNLNFVQGSTTEGGITYDHNSGYASEQMNFRVGNNTTHMSINGAGIVTKPLQPAFMARAVGATNLSSTTWHTIAFGNERFDNNNDFSSNTFTAPVTGKYQMNVFMRLHSIDNAATYYFLSLSTSNNTYYHIHGSNGWASDPYYHTLGSSYVVDMDAGDTAIVQFYQASGASQTDIQGNEGYFSGCLVA